MCVNLFVIQENTYFNSLRLLEDNNYQADMRQQLGHYVDETADSTDDLDVDLSFYERFIWKVLNVDYENINRVFGTSWKLESCYFPWNRTFEIGFYAHQERIDGLHRANWSSYKAKI